MNENPLLRAAAELFTDRTVISFACVLIFLIIYNRIYRYAQRWKANRWLKTLITSWVIVSLMFGVYILIVMCSGYISSLRFNNGGSFPQSPVHSWVAGLFASISVSFLYTLNEYIRNLFIKKTRSKKLKPLYDGIIVFLLVNIFVITVNAFTNQSILIAISFFGDYISATLGCALAFITYSYHQSFQNHEIQEKTIKILRLQEQLTQSQLDALSSKINPHFLYNSLNSIAGLSTTDGEKTRDMAIALSKLFRYNINKDDSNYATIKDEVEMVMIYLEIEKIRFEENLQYTIDISEAAANELIPKHLLQPLVENAVKHGMTKDGVHINIAVAKNEKVLTLAVSDSGEPFDVDFNPGYGIKSLYDKLDLLANGNYEISFLSNPKAVQIKLGKHHQ